MNLSSIVALLQLVLSLLSQNPSPSNQALASQAISLATQALAEQPVQTSSSTVTYSVPTSTDNTQPIVINVTNPPASPTPATNSPTLGAVPANQTANGIIVSATADGGSSHATSSFDRLGEISLATNQNSSTLESVAITFSGNAAISSFLNAQNVWLQDWNGNNVVSAGEANASVVGNKITWNFVPSVMALQENKSFTFYLNINSSKIPSSIDISQPLTAAIQSSQDITYNQNGSEKNIAGDNLPLTINSVTYP